MNFARQELSWSAEEYWYSSFFEFEAARKVAYDRIKREDFRAGLIDARIRQLAGDKKAQPFDEFPAWKRETKQQSSIAANVRALKELMGRKK